MTKGWPGVLDDLFGGATLADQANTRERARTTAQIAATIEEIDSALNELRSIDEVRRVNVDGIRNRINHLLDNLADLQRELHEQRSHDGRPLAIKGAHGVYR